MTEAQDARRRVQGRSPSFPFISLEKAIAQTKKLQQHSRGHPVRVTTASEAWGYKAESSGGRQTVSALKAFGLLSDAGSGAERRVELTEFAKRLLRDPPPNIRSEMLREAALRPSAIGEFWRHWGENRPPDSDCRWALGERGFTEQAADTFLTVYDATIRFAELTKSGYDVDPRDEADQTEAGAEKRHAVAPGDSVQWVTQGAFQFAGPRRVTEVTNDPQRGAFASVEGYAGKLPLEQLELVESMAGTEDRRPGGDAERPASPPAPHAPKPLMQRAFFPLPEGHVALEFPEELSRDSFEDMTAWLAVAIRRAGRAVRKERTGGATERPFDAEDWIKDVIPRPNEDPHK